MGIMILRISLKFQLEILLHWPDIEFDNILYFCALLLIFRVQYLDHVTLFWVELSEYSQRHNNYPRTKFQSETPLFAFMMNTDKLAKNWLKWSWRESFWNFESHPGRSAGVIRTQMAGVTVCGYLFRAPLRHFQLFCHIYSKSSQTGLKFRI
jgi:hypothetical protein